MPSIVIAEHEVILVAGTGVVSETVGSSSVQLGPGRIETLSVGSSIVMGSYVLIPQGAVLAVEFDGRRSARWEALAGSRRLLFSQDSWDSRLRSDSVVDFPETNESSLDDWIAESAKLAVSALDQFAVRIGLGSAAALASQKPVPADHISVLMQLRDPTLRAFFPRLSCQRFRVVPWVKLSGVVSGETVLVLTDSWNEEKAIALTAERACVVLPIVVPQDLVSQILSEHEPSPS